VVAEPVVSNTKPKNRRGHNTAERINCISKFLHVLDPRPQSDRGRIAPARFHSSAKVLRQRSTNASCGRGEGAEGPSGRACVGLLPSNN
jgi:hypothetical protein